MRACLHLALHMVLGATLLSAAARADVATTWVARFSGFKGDRTCAYGELDCNRCVNNVAEQFMNLTQRTAHTVRVKEWEWDRLRNYTPSDRRPNELLTLRPGRGHFQSFVRSQMDVHGFPDYFASHSQLGGRGAVFAGHGGSDNLGRATDGSLSYLINASGDHPGGMQAIGEYLLFATENNEVTPSIAKLEIVKTSNPTGPRTVVDLPGLTRVANVAVQHLVGGGYLILASESSYHNRYMIYYTASLATPKLERLWTGKFSADIHSGIYVNGDERIGFENLSIVTECGTGKTFVIGATAPEFFANDNVTGLYGNGKSTWMLYELVPGSSVALRYVTRNTRDMFATECDPRASGTAFAGPRGELGLYCHQRAQDEDVRTSGFGCALSIGLLPIVSEYFCVDALSADRQILFTEYWPHTTSPDKSMSSLIDVSITVTNSGVIDGNTGMICLSPSGSKTCNWKVDRGQQLQLVPYGVPSTLRWQGQCTERNGLSSAGGAVECVRFANSALSVQLVGST